MKGGMVNTNNSYQYIDYNKQIIPVKNDMRTTYDFGHRHQIASGRIGPPLVSILDRCRTLGTTWMHKDYSTETRSQYCYKASNAFEQRAERTLSCKKGQFIQREQERMFANPPKAIDSTRSKYQRDYLVPVAQYSEPFVQNERPYVSPQRSQDTIYAHAPGHYKYMDPYATSKMLGHPQNSVDQQNGIGRKDAITLWDWFEYPKAKGYGLKFFPVKQRTAKVPLQDRAVFKLMIHDRLIPNKSRFVPHNGKRTENMAEYQNPVTISPSSDLNFGGNMIPMPYIELSMGQSEHSMFNSGKRIDSFIKQI